MQLLRALITLLITGIVISSPLASSEKGVEFQKVNDANASLPRLKPELRLFLETLPAVVGAQKVTSGSIDTKPVIVTFFASWCPPCLDEFSHLNQLMEEFMGTDLRVVAINVYETWDGNDADRMVRFIEKTQPVFPAIVGSEQVRRNFGGIDRIPTVYGFDRTGNLVYRFVHKRGSATTHASYAELKQVASGLLQSD